LDAEIISADSRQVYRGLDIGTAKPTAEERARVPHHGIDICALAETYTAGRFFTDAHRWIRDIQERGKRVLIVGGSGLYVRVLLQGLFEGPPKDDALRARLETRLREEGKDRLLAELAERDPRMADIIDRRNPVRIVRALEVCLLTGQPYSRIREERLRRSPHRYFPVALSRERATLHARINARVDAMLAQGLCQEVRALLDAGADPGSNALNTVGYKEITAYLSSLLPYDAAVELLKTNTRRFARRQMTWFRREPGLRWYDVEETADAEGADAEAVARRIIEDMPREA
ncbi:MAG: tRNA (adenosine(37)-N6)-dimethylallyltransferase MiaA, partial [Bacteroidota bacterium]|nr:tRNA (adenosine(37)-N6)-dimethylallyltransferase MiaA [Bacteroidota bacterium]